MGAPYAEEAMEKRGVVFLGIFGNWPTRIRGLDGGRPMSVSGSFPRRTGHEDERSDKLEAVWNFCAAF